MQALVVEKLGTATVQTIEIPTLSKGEILVKVHSVALNPADFKYRDFMGQPNSGLGSDFSGTVVQISSEEVNNVRIGDKVAGMIHGGLVRVGSFAKYLKTEHDLVWRIPDNISFEEAAALGGAGPHTAYQTLYLSQNLAPPYRPLNLKVGTPVLIWGATSSVGLYATQLAALSGYTVIAVASKKNFEYLLTLGASLCYDYKDTETPWRIHDIFPDLVHAIDCISQNGTSSLIVKSMGRLEHKTQTPKITILQPLQPEELEKIKGIEIEFNNAYKLCGKAFELGGVEIPADPETRKDAVNWLKYIGELVKEKKLIANPIWKREGGLEKINEGIDLIKAGKVSAQKLVYNLV